ncbi:hypothetical protein HCN44_000830 [Aphidius gifuensis]|uniref:Uncharacterized protein n=1 Tax=Aphidius gifuensis TaxID=684658 RepID=A0A835CS93_APHGI|nr:hypothetical protein HCN44_000830 [Aphidius gifuensis]
MEDKESHHIEPSRSSSSVITSIITPTQKAIQSTSGIASTINTSQQAIQRTSGIASTINTSQQPIQSTFSGIASTISASQQAVQSTSGIASTINTSQQAIQSTSSGTTSVSHQAVQKTANDIRPTLKTLREAKARVNQNLQPRPIVVGSIEKITASYISIDEDLFQVLNPTHAIESMLKVYYALNCECPPEAKNIWQFMAFAVFRLSSSNQSPAISDLLVAIRAAKLKLSQRTQVQN